MTERERLQHITKENVLQAIARIKEEGVPSARESNTFDLMYEEVAYPPKYIISLAGYFSEKGQFIFASTFGAGDDSFCFTKLRELGFEILHKEKTKDSPKPKEADRNLHFKYCYRVIDEKLDEELFKQYFTEYVRYCHESNWLSGGEGYKFRFGRWVAANINLDKQSDEDILAKCIESQDQIYDSEGKIKGINFIISQKRYQDEFISIVDIKNLKRLKNGELLNDYDLKGSPLSFPKLSVWAGVMIPEEQMIFANNELTNGIAHLFHLDDFPKSGVRAFNLANTCLKEIKAAIKYHFMKEAKELIHMVLPETDIQSVDMVWLVQDFILFLNRRVLSTSKNYFWVNQGDNYQIELEYGIVAAPDHKLQHHDRLRNLHEGDVIIHYANSAIRAISTVTKEFAVKPRPNSPNGENDLIVEVAYKVLEHPIPIDEVKLKFLGKEYLLPAKNGPLSKDLSVVQMYMCEFNEESYMVLFNEPNYWIFQGNLKIYDIVSALSDNGINTWSVKAHKDSIKIGDKVILWVSGNQAGCYALAEVTSEVFDGKDDESELRYYVDARINEISSRVSIKITHNLAAAPILKDQIQGIEDLTSLKVGSQGTNFRATKIEYDTFLKLAEKNMSNRKYWLYAPGENANMWGEFYQNGIMALGWDQLGNLGNYQTQEEIALKLREIEATDSSKKNDAKANFEFIHILKEGDVIFVKKGNSKLLGYGIVTGTYEFDDQKTTYKNFRKVDWKNNGVWDVGHVLVQKTLTDITKYTSELNGFNHYYERLFACMGIGRNIKEAPMAKNQILYGPPGTGKTFKLKAEYFSKYTTKETLLSPEQHFENVVSECSWWQVIAVALIQLGKSKVSAISEHPWVLQKVKLSNSNTIRPTLWGQLQSHTIETCEFVNVKSKQQPFIFNKTEDSLWEIINEEEVKEQAPEIYDLIDSIENFNPSSDKEIQRYVFTTFHQSYSYEDFIEGIKPIMMEGEENGNVAYRIEDGVFKQLCKKAEMDPENRYAIFIDEINRGNVSAIFGELITLIEQDKRKGAANEMSALLPYSKRQFSVPNNVDICGTMNTADRSVEALDTALRRRFSFVEMLPQPELLQDKGENGSGKVADIDLEKLLQTINERIEVLVDRDHTIGHAFFMDVTSLDDLRMTFKNKIIPLLQEYFYGDYHKMELIIGEAFFSKPEIRKIKFAAASDSIERDGVVYHLVDISDRSKIDDAKFILMLKNLIDGVE